MDWILALISIMALACSVAALTASAVALSRLKVEQADREEGRALQVLQEMRRRSRDLSREFSENPDDAACRSSYQDAMADLARVYEEACRRYYERQTDRGWFYGIYGRELLSWVEQGPFRESFGRRRPEYPYTARAYREVRRTLH